MINKDSIVTAYDEHLTLVEWLQKVENALNNAVLTNLGIAKLSDKDNVAAYQVTATFADNTTIVSDTFTLPSTDIVTAFGNLTTLVNGFDNRITDNTADITKKQDLITSATDLTAKTVTADTIKTDSYLKPASIEKSEENIAFHATPIEGVNITLPFAKWRVSNGKLSIVATVRLEVTSNDDVTLPLGQQFGYAGITLPEKVGETLVPISASIVDIKRASAFGIKKDGSIAIFLNNIKYSFMKYSNTAFEMDIGCEWSNQVTLKSDFKYLIRIEANYML